MNINRARFANTIRWQFFANGIQVVFGGAYLLLLGRLLGPGDFGIFSVVISLVAVCGLVFEMRLQEVIARDFCNLDDADPVHIPSSLHLYDFYILEIFSRLVPAVLVGLLLVSDLVKLFLDVESGSSRLILLAVIGFVLSKSGSGVSNGLLRVLGRTDLVAGCMMIDSGGRLITSIIYALVWQLNVTAALWVALIFGAVSNGLQAFFALHRFNARVSLPAFATWTFDGALSRLRTSQRLIFSNLGISGGDLMAKDLDVVLISSLLSSEKVGIYKMAKSFVQIFWRAIDPFYIAIMPEVQKLWQRNESQSLESLLRKTTIRLFLLSISLVVIGNLIVASTSVKLLGAGYVEVPMLTLVMSVWVVVCAPLIWGSPLAVAINRPEISVGGSAIGTIAGLIAFSYLTPTFGLVGAALAWNVTLISGFVFTVGMAVWLTSKKPPFKKRDN